MIISKNIDRANPFKLVISLISAIGILYWILPLMMTHKKSVQTSRFVTLSAKISLMLGEHKSGFRRKGHIYYIGHPVTPQNLAQIFLA